MSISDWHTTNAHESLDDDARDQAALHAVGALDPEHAAAYESHVARCAPCRAEVDGLRGVVADLALAAPVVAAPEGLRSRVLDAAVRVSRSEGAALRVLAADARPPDAAASQLPDAVDPTSSSIDAAAAQPWKEWPRGDGAEDMLFVPADGTPWEVTSVPGIEARRLFVDAASDRITMLVRMAAGSAYPAHVHGGPEECYVIAGDIRVGGGIHMRAGDYQRVVRGQSHPVQSTDGGCLLLITSSLNDELLGGASA